MIKETEVRIGNLIKVAPSKEWVQDYIGTEVVIDIDVLMNIIFHSDKYPYEPIPLTKQLLYDLGFESNNDENDLLVHPKCNLFEISEEPDNSFAFIWDSAYSGAPFQYVHQLQNLYFALTGNELEIAGK